MISVCVFSCLLIIKLIIFMGRRVVGSVPSTIHQKLHLPFPVVGCGYPGSSANSRVTIQPSFPPVAAGLAGFPVPVGTTALYSCEEPYISLGDIRRVCQQDLTWSGKPPFCGLNVAMHKPLLLPQHRNAWLTNDGIISTRAKDCYSHYLQPEESLTWKLDLTEVFQVHSIRVLTLGDFPWSANVTLYTVSKEGQLSDAACGRIDYNGTDQIAALSVPCRTVLPARWVQIDLTFLGHGRLRLCEINVLSVNGLTSDLCPHEASAKSVMHGSCLSFHSHGRATWGAAMQTCRKLGGTLVQNIDNEEQAFLQAKLHYLHRFQPTEAFYWMGLFRSVNMTTMEDKWQWTNGIPATTFFWSPNQPDNIGSRQFCGGMSGRTGWLWNDLNCESGQGFWICRSNFTSCPIPEQPVNGLITMLDRRLGGSVNYKCEEGLEMTGIASRSCLSSATWSGILPHCSPPGESTTSPMIHITPGVQDPVSTPTVRDTTSDSLEEDKNDTGVHQRKYDVENTTTPIPQQESPIPTTAVVSSTRTRMTISVQPGTSEMTMFPEPSDTVISTVTAPEAAVDQVQKLPAMRENGTSSPVAASTETTALITQSTTETWEHTGKIPTDFLLPGPELNQSTAASFGSSLSATTESGVPSALPTVQPVNRVSMPIFPTESPRSSPLLTGSRCRHVPLLFNGKYALDTMGPTVIARYSCNQGFNIVGIPFLTCTSDGFWRGIMPLCIPGYTVVTSEATTFSLGTSLPTITENVPLQTSPAISLSTTKGLTIPTATSTPTSTLPPVTQNLSLATTVLETVTDDTSVSLTPTSTIISQTSLLVTSPLPVERSLFSVVHTATSNLPTSYSSQATSDESTTPKVTEFKTISLPTSEVSQSTEPVPSLATTSSSTEADITTEVIEQQGKDVITSAFLPRRITMSDDSTTPSSSTCPPLPFVPFAETLFYRDVVMFRCFPGYIMVGNNITKCLPEGVWEPAPDCIAVDCGFPEKVSHGVVILMNGTSTYESVAAYSCSDPAVLQGTHYRTCEEDGRWEGPIPDCSLDILAQIPAESRQQEPRHISWMTILFGILGTVGGIMVVMAAVFSFRWLKREDSTSVAVSPTMYSITSEHSPQNLMTERASVRHIFSRNQYVPSSVSSHSAYDSNNSISDASTQTGRLHAV